MPANTERRSSQARTNGTYRFASELQPSLQSLLAALVNIDFEHNSDIETIRNSSVDEWLKQTAIKKLEERQHERRSSYVRQLTGLQKRLQVAAT
jgi:hypothetical protein